MNLNGIKITWLGHATFRIQTPKGKTILIDPWVMQNPACPENEKNVKSVDVMLITHGHGDHIGDAVEIAKKHTPKIVGTPELCGWLEKKGVQQIFMMNKGGTQQVGEIKVTMVHADHSCGIQDGEQLVYGGEACGYVIEFDNGVKIYHAGDTNVFGDMKIIHDLTRPTSPCSLSATTSPWAERSRLRLRIAEGEDRNPHALRNVSSIDGNSRRIEQARPRSRYLRNEARPDNRMKCRRSKQNCLWGGGRPRPPVT
jgi:hypothetical protein